jgi:hypothetical protein
MVVHMVLLRVKKGAAKAEVATVMESIGALAKVIPGITSYRWGPYSSPEGMSKGFTHGFCMTFDSAAHRDAYLPHPEHEKVKAKVLALLDGGLDGVVAFDFEG